MSISSLVVRWRFCAPYLLSVVRIMGAFTFMQFGTAKLFAFPASISPDGATVPLASQMGVAGSLEAFGGFLLLIGWFTRPIAFLLSGEMAFAYFIVHAPQSFWTMVNLGTEPVLFCFLWLYISSAGPGPWSLDAILRRRP